MINHQWGKDQRRCIYNKHFMPQDG
jgi:hypothetical protein